MNFEEKLESGHYNSKLTVPSRKDPTFNEARKALLIDQNRLNALFKKDILEHYGLAKHPRADEIYDFAREYTDGRPRLVPSRPRYVRQPLSRESAHMEDPRHTVLFLLNRIEAACCPPSNVEIP